jgi:hypothetical protein
MEAMDLGIDAQGTRVRTREKDAAEASAPYHQALMITLINNRCCSFSSILWRLGLTCRSPPNRKVGYEVSQSFGITDATEAS